ncbi:hypothetical protein HYPSUDRAFT_906708 [Hypholoma sublateritium FD-334 SS-4]|uniref:Uncharacterized protein n=1 Tax=Hypholoma sublateritium (strain FD-334 SS-4) TaxID=945553 RepID=A0A0D2PGB0_HYPSF|nr:hypothetical protein HYPSUDRAFT_906708 [Hypholoma sublateritium FD-334 SS-4]
MRRQQWRVQQTQRAQSRKGAPRDERKQRKVSNIRRHPSLTPLTPRCPLNAAVQMIDLHEREQGIPNGPLERHTRHSASPNSPGASSRRRCRRRSPSCAPPFLRTAPPAAPLSAWYTEKRTCLCTTTAHRGQAAVSQWGLGGVALTVNRQRHPHSQQRLPLKATCLHAAETVRGRVRGNVTRGSPLFELLMSGPRGAYSVTRLHYHLRPPVTIAAPRLSRLPLALNKFYGRLSTRTPRPTTSCKVSRAVAPHCASLAPLWR